VVLAGGGPQQQASGVQRPADFDKTMRYWEQVLNFVISNQIWGFNFKSEIFFFKRLVPRKGPSH
jgi:hypothetical protein